MDQHQLAARLIKVAEELTAISNQLMEETKKEGSVKENPKDFYFVRG